MTKSAPVILLNITHGFQARMLLRSKIRTRLLEKGAHLVIVSNNADDEYFREEFEDQNTDVLFVKVQSGRIETALVKLRQYLLMNPSLGETLNAKREIFYRTSSPIKTRFVTYGNKILGRSSFLRGLYLRIESWLFSGREFDMVLEQVRPDLVVAGTPGFNRPDSHILRAARRAGIPSTTVMLSWDNLTSKGYMGAQPDSLLVWSKLMTQEAVDLHGFPAKKVYQTGAAQFDHYWDRPDESSIVRWKATNGIPADSKLVVYGTINPALLPHEQSIVSDLADALGENGEDFDYFLWVRLHPQMVKGGFATEIDTLMALEGRRVHIEIPDVQSEQLQWDLPASDSEHMRNLLCAADVLVTTCSTLVIDAACVDTPVINIFFDCSGEFDPDFSVARFKKYTHYEKILTTKGIAVADSIQEFLHFVEQYSLDPTIDASGRSRILSQQLGTFDGQAGIRAADKLLDLASFSTN